MTGSASSWANGGYAKIFDKWSVASTEIAKSTLNPAPHLLRSRGKGEVP